MSFACLPRLALLCLLLDASSALAEDDVAAGQRLYAPCAACHGAHAEGNRSVAAPALAGREAWYLVRQLRNFRSGARGVSEDDLYGMQMARMAEQLWDDGEVQRVAAYVSALPRTSTERSVRGKPARGKAAYATCAACHGEDARGNAELGAPQLAGLEDWYVVNQLRLFRAAARGAADGDAYGLQMRAGAAALPDEQGVADVAAYLATLEPKDPHEN
jgi:cytochrome c oxidase subunit 2